MTCSEILQKFPKWTTLIFINEAVRKVDYEKYFSGRVHYCISEPVTIGAVSEGYLFAAGIEYNGPYKYVLAFNDKKEFIGRFKFEPTDREYDMMERFKYDGEDSDWDADFDDDYYDEEDDY